MYARTNKLLKTHKKCQLLISLKYLNLNAIVQRQLKNLHYYLKQLKFPTQKNKKAEI